jgi:hypothetical protein
MRGNESVPVQKAYYLLKPVIPRPLQIALRRRVISRKRRMYEHVWPIDPAAGKKPAGWPGWPEGKRFALVLTHDVDTAGGQERCRRLAGLETGLGFRSSFNFVPERYAVSPELRQCLSQGGFEVGVHGLLHDGKLYSSREIFLHRAKRINRYLEQWQAVGFRSPAMHHNLKWIHDLNIEYDASTFDTDPFEPQSDGMGTIFPFAVRGNAVQKNYVELPYTLPQDFTLFVLMKEKTIDIWKRKLAWICENGGMALVNTHPDYMCFEGGNPGPFEYSCEHYEGFLEYIRKEHENQYWHVLPRDMARFWESFCGESQPA